jgi:hypothetical protein
MFDNDLDRAAMKRVSRALHRAYRTLGPDDVVEGTAAVMMGAFSQAIVAKLGPIHGRGLLLALVKLVDDHTNGPECDENTCTIHADVGEVLAQALGTDAACLAPLITATLQLSCLTPEVFAQALDYLSGNGSLDDLPGAELGPQAS